MSSNSSTPNLGLTLLGGYPTKRQDLAACIVFAIAYALLLPLIIHRFFHKSSRCTILIRPTIFTIIRLATFIVRAVQSGMSDPSIALYITEKVLLLCGFILLCEPLLALLEYHLKRNFNPELELQHGRDVLHLGIVAARIALMTALGLGIATGSLFSNIYDAQGQVQMGVVNTIKGLRYSNAALCIVVTVSTVLIAIVASIRDQNLPRKATLFLEIAGSVLCFLEKLQQTVSSAYKLGLYAHRPVASPLSARMKAVFYILCLIPEFIVTSMLFVTNVEEWFEAKHGKLNNKIEKLTRKHKPVSDELIRERDLYRRHIDDVDTNEMHKV
ncbi:hypothetical protein OIO90_004889 [Microbotryomycetes sp. JL221]|nr:hypothetical protein OIO90_004889 [Microbotryomycetes sp. JL221]